ncbi:MAG TPA: hypothetical protein DCE56_14160 [Cyanobacteria bacterium UBA8553]|nr:hypothetical protein [Cyanobacteria bacterium UBA8553]
MAAQPPLTKMKRFWCKDVPFMGYEIIKDKQIVLSPRQLRIKAVQKPDQVATQFIASNNLEQIEVTLPNRSKVTAYPLPTVVAYWSYLNSFGLLPEHEKKVLAALMSGEQIKEEKVYLQDSSSRVAPTPVENIDHPVPLARSLKVKILGEAELTVFVLDKSHYPFWVEETEGLEYIKASPTALTEQIGGARKNEFLKKKKCTFALKTCFQERDGKIFQLNIRPFCDWIRIWQYFGNQNNSHALSILAELALCNIDKRIQTTSVESQPALQVASFKGAKTANAA